MTQVTITVTGDKEAMARLRKIGSGVVNLQTSMDKIGSYLTGFFSGEVFASRGGVIGESWPRLSAKYAAYKARTFPGRPPLIRRGVMQRSFKAKTGRASARIYNSAGHFGFHQEGTRRLPARVMMKVDQAREKRIIDIIQGEIAKDLA